MKEFANAEGRESLYKVHMGDIMALHGDMETALKMWDETVSENPGKWQAWCDHADRMKKLGRYEEALSDYEKCFDVQEKPRLADGLYSRAQLFEQLGRYAEAIAECERIIAIPGEAFGKYEGDGIDEQHRHIKRLENMIKGA